MVLNVAVMYCYMHIMLCGFCMQMSDDSTRIGSPAGRSADEPHIGKYRLIKTIGKGNFAKVKLAKHLPTGRQVSFLVFILCFCDSDAS